MPLAAAARASKGTGKAGMDCIIASVALGYDAAASVTLLPMFFIHPDLVPDRRWWPALLCGCAMLTVAPTSAAIVAIGGGEVARDKAAAKGQSAPTDFRGAADADFAHKH
jgi:hypothetical protein